MRTYNLFISHSWNYGDPYYRLINLLRQRSYFRFKDYSVPKDDPIHDARTVAQLHKALKNRMQPCSVVLIIGGVYATYSKWMNKEINLAKNGFSSPKPILAIKPRGSDKRSSVVREAADKTVGWYTNSIVAAIRELG